MLFSPGTPSWNWVRNRPNRTDTPIQIADQMPASLIDTACASRCTTKRSTARRTVTITAKMP